MSSYVIDFHEATRSKSLARLGIFGPSGCGKTYTGLLIGVKFQIMIDPTKQFSVVDTEHGRAELYTDDFKRPDGKPWFRVFNMRAPYEPEHYIAALEKAERLGAQVCLLDSISHEWMGGGGVLHIVDEAVARMGGNKWGGWAIATPRHNAFLEALLGSSMHVICTMRARTEWARDEGSNKPRKIGLEPIQREGIEYEFDVTLQQDLDHSVVVSKSRAKPLPVGIDFALNEESTAQMAEAYMNWLREGVDAAPKETATTLETPTLETGAEGTKEEGKDETPAQNGASLKPASKGRITRALNELQDAHGDWKGGTNWEEQLTAKLPQLPWNKRSIAKIEELTEEEVPDLLATISATADAIAEQKAQMEKEASATLV